MVKLSIDFKYDNLDETLDLEISRLCQTALISLSPSLARADSCLTLIPLCTEGAELHLVHTVLLGPPDGRQLEFLPKVPPIL